MPKIDDPVERFVSVVKFYLSGWHIKPPGVKKPLNPILGETFGCYWEYPDHTRGYYISEQTSHHPPKSSYFFMAPEHYIRIDGTLKPRSRFLGNSAASLMEGIAILRLTNRGTSRGGERYILTQPNMYARGILFGKMKYELGDHSFVRCPEHNLVADLEFKTKGYFGGTYNAIGGIIKNEKTGEALYELSGLWTEQMYIKNLRDGHKELLFDATHAKHSPPLTRPIEQQDERESQRLWMSTCQAIKKRDHDAATEEKTKIEDRQREEAAKRADEGLDWNPRLFRRVRGGPSGSEEGDEDLDWIINAKVDGPTPEAQAQQILSITPILPNQIQKRLEIPPRRSSQISPEPSPVTNKPAQATNDVGGDLIDFGFSEPASTPAPGPTKSHETTQKQSTNHDLPPGLQAPLIPTVAQPIKRQDTESSDIDVFVDAAEG
ncbi:MAG: hypothetical protein M1834_004682 [Cirrosporium novae-zelandiae]|nr:MAG: hypothetical protein M1834_004682 [Cirrosporium novae-zelandiae]